MQTTSPAVTFFLFFTVISFMVFKTNRVVWMLKTDPDLLTVVVVACSWLTVGVVTCSCLTVVVVTCSGLTVVVVTCSCFTVIVHINMFLWQGNSKWSKYLNVHVLNFCNNLLLSNMQNRRTIKTCLPSIYETVLRLS